MNERWHTSKLFFDWVPLPLPAHERQDGDFLLLIPDLHPEMVFLNGPGAFLYHQCDGERTMLDVLKRYMVEYLRADREDVAWEVISLLRQMEGFYALYLLPPTSCREAADELAESGGRELLHA